MSDDTIIRKIRDAMKQDVFEGGDRRQPPMIGDSIKWLVGVAAPVVTALIVMYSTQQVLIRDIEELEHDIAEIKQINISQWQEISALKARP